MSKTHSVLEPMDIVVIYAHATHKEKRFRVFPKLADDLYDLLANRKRFWEWERELKLLGKITAAQAAMIKGLRERPPYKLLEKYMRDVLTCEGTTFVCGEWCGSEYTEEEHAVLLELRDKIEKEYYHER